MKRLFLLTLTFSNLALLSFLQANEKPLAELKRDADKVLLEPDNVLRRKLIAPVFEYAGHCVVIGETNQALKYFAKGLEHQPWNLEAQLAVARLLMQSGDSNAAQQKAELVWKNAESDGLLIGAGQLLGYSFAGYVEDDAMPPGAYGLVLIPFGKADIWLLQELKTNLHQMLGIPVLIRKPTLQIPPPGRDPLHFRAEDLKASIIRSAAQHEFNQLLTRLNLSTNSLSSDDEVFAFAEKILNEERNKEPGRQFREELEFLKRLGPQWDSTNLIGQLRRILPVRPRSGIGFLAVTPMDLYANESRFVFGLAEQNANCGVFSYRRYKNDLFDEPPNRERLRQRALKQALSSTGLLFGIPRCTDPTCARAYANSLTEHDAKEIRLCPQCQEGFNKRFQ